MIYSPQPWMTKYTLKIALKFVQFCTENRLHTTEVSPAKLHLQNNMFNTTKKACNEKTFLYLQNQNWGQKKVFTQWKVSDREKNTFQLVLTIQFEHFLKPFVFRYFLFCVIFFHYKDFSYINYIQNCRKFFRYNFFINTLISLQ